MADQAAASAGSAGKPSSSSQSCASVSRAKPGVASGNAFAAKLAASIVGAGRLAATAARARPGAALAARGRSPGVRSPSQSVCNEIANLAVAAAALRARDAEAASSQDGGEHEIYCGSPLKFAPADRIDPAVQTHDSARVMLCFDDLDDESQMSSQMQTAQCSDSCKTESAFEGQHRRASVQSRESSTDSTALCEWDVKVEKTFITVCPMRPTLAHTASAPGCIGLYSCPEGNDMRGRSISRRRKRWQRRGGRTAGRGCGARAPSRQERAQAAEEASVA